ncbi:MULTISPECIES: hypothetical protein [Helicobacter]|uniref:Uncharacterized protein n=1 Tax=Helicobacter bilis ATCC 43879 TaxID=613026 RepID=C3XFI1_9HELI|nr:MULTISPECIES: hypothetical protein [Helicobacter]EEO23770.1 hypothetical protein HRAG_00827 [Helicobacter bilis ATCC 43879]
MAKKKNNQQKNAIQNKQQIDASSTSLEQQLKDILESRAKLEKQQQDLESENKIIKDEIHEIDRILIDNKQQMESIKGQMQIKQQSVKAAQDNLDETTQTLDSKNKDHNKEKKDKEALDKYIDTEKQNLQKDENKLKNLKDELKTKYEKFSYNKKDSKESKSSLAFMDKTQSRTQQEIHMVIPKEDRPTTGTLKEDKHERLLEISQWDEVESATEEAQRLKASLSVKHDKSQ